MRRRLRRAIEIVLSPLLYAAFGLIRFYRPSFHTTSPLAYSAADALGVWPLIDHYHEPLISPKRHLRHRPDEPRSIPAIDLREQAQVQLLKQFEYQEELLAIADDWPGGSEPYYRNLAFPAGDAEILHCLLRHFRPERVVEIGSGESTKFAANALRLTGSGALVCVEPYEAPHLEGLGFEVVRSRVEELDPAFFDNLGDGDVLFIDSSHVVRPQGDVVYLFNEVLPRLKSGVLVHVHDVFTPRDYPQAWLDRRWLWTEQYLLEAVLATSDRFGILLAVNHLHHDHRAELHHACPVLARGDDTREPGSFWLRVA